MSIKNWPQVARSVPHSLSSRLSKRWLIDRLFVRALFAHLPEVKGRVLDVGCGNQRYRYLMPMNYIGLDFREPAEIIADATRLPIQSGAIDVVLCFQMLDDQPEPDQFLQELRRAIRVGGRLLLSVDLSWRVHDAPRDYFRFTEYGLAFLLNRANFLVDGITPLGGFWSLMANRFVYRLHETFGRLRPIRPLVAVTGFSIFVLAGVLEKLDFRPEDTQGYFVSAIKLK